MAQLTIDGLHYRMDGRPDAPVLVFSNSLGPDLSLWDRQVAILSSSFRVLRYDSRGHGRSVGTPGEYTIESLARDAVRLLDGLHVQQAHFCGLSLGGMVGMCLAARWPARVGRLVLANTSALMGPRELWDTRIAAVRAAGMEAVAGGVVERWLTAGFRESHPAETGRVRSMLLASPPEGYCSCCAAIRDMDQRELPPSIQSPTLVIAGANDPATPPAMGRSIADAIPGARYVTLSAAHLSNIEAAEAFNDALADFLLA